MDWISSAITGRHGKHGFADVEESHTTLPRWYSSVHRGPINFLDHSRGRDLGFCRDHLSCLDIPLRIFGSAFDPRRFSCLRRIANYFNIPIRKTLIT